MAYINGNEILFSAEITEVPVDIAFPYEKYGLPIVYLDGDTTGISKDNKVTLNYRYGDRTGTCTLKWQGSSSLAYPKKNYTIVFDNAFEAAAGWGFESKYCLKADWVDFSHCRNVVSAKLWGDVVRSRSTSDLVTRLSALPNGGAIDGFPCFVVINGEWKGIYNFNIPKDDYMLGMGSGTKEAILCCEGTGSNDACAFKAEATLGVEFELEYSSDGWAESDIQASLNTLIRAVMNSDGTDIDTAIAQHLDINSAIDYMLFSQLIGHHDGLYKNYILATYDGKKWFFSAYDMDNVFGQHYPGDNFDTASVGMLWCNAHKLFDLLYKHKREHLKNRLDELLSKEHTIIGVGNLYDGVMSVAQVAEKFTNYGLKIPLPAYVADAEMWTDVPSSALNNVGQAVSWYAQRVDLLRNLYAAEAFTGTKGLTYDYQQSHCTGIGSCCEIDILLGTYGGIKVVGASAFANNTTIESVTIPERYTTIYESAFKGCTSLKQIKLPSTLTGIAYNAFNGCTSLKAIDLSNLTNCSSHLFVGCTSLARVKLPKNLPLSVQMFRDCTALTDIFYNGTIAEWEALSKGVMWDSNSGAYTVHCSDGDIAKA